MSLNDVRKVVDGIIPPKLPSETTATEEEIKEISQMCPFYGPIVKGRGKFAEGEDSFLFGAAEMFVRIFRALKKAGMHAILRGLQLSDLQEVDQQLSNGGTTMIEAEYPMLDLHVPTKDAFGAGVRAAYGILEYALAKNGAPSMPKTVEEHTLADKPTSMPKIDEAGEPVPPAIMDDAAPAADNSGSDQVLAGTAVPRIFVFTAAQTDGGWLISWPADGMTVASLNEMMKMVESLFGKGMAEKTELTTSGDRVVCHFMVGGTNA